MKFQCNISNVKIFDPVPNKKKRESAKYEFTINLLIFSLSKKKENNALFFCVFFLEMQRKKILSNTMISSQEQNGSVLLNCVTLVSHQKAVKLLKTTVECGA